MKTGCQKNKLSKLLENEQSSLSGTSTSLSSQRRRRQVEFQDRSVNPTSDPNQISNMRKELNSIKSEVHRLIKQGPALKEKSQDNPDIKEDDSNRTIKKKQKYSEKDYKKYNKANKQIESAENNQKTYQKICISYKSEFKNTDFDNQFQNTVEQKLYMLNLQIDKIRKSSQNQEQSFTQIRKFFNNQIHSLISENNQLKINLNKGQSKINQLQSFVNKSESFGKQLIQKIKSLENTIKQQDNQITLLKTKQTNISVEIQVSNPYPPLPTNSHNRQKSQSKRISSLQEYKISHSQASIKEDNQFMLSQLNRRQKICKTQYNDIKILEKKLNKIKRESEKKDQLIEEINNIQIARRFKQLNQKYS